MIIVKLMGGLGNQMFQYAFGKFLSVKHKTDLQLDLSYLLDRTPRENFVFRDYDLDIFPIKSQFMSESKLNNLLVNRQKDNIVNRLKGVFNKHLEYVFESQFEFNNKYLDIANHSYLEGYWQSPKYFESISEIIRKDFLLNPDLTDKQVDMYKNIINSNSVCVNFRRADFVTIKTAIETHGVIPQIYYEKALDLLKKKNKDLHVYVFSDEIDWCKKHVKFDYPTTFVDHELSGFKFSVYLFLMSKCKHYVIPNSTFAWWAAWMNNNPDKIVIAPKQWFATEEMNKQTIDLIPESWIRL